MNTPMTVGDLIAELSKWPSYAEVYCSKEIKPPGAGSLHSISKVIGLAGAHISGRDSCVSIEFK